MKRVPGLVLVLVFCGCVSGSRDLARRQAYVDTRPDLTQETREDILARRIRPGMTMEEVAVTWGAPYRKTRDSDGFEFWEYDSHHVVFKDGILLRWVNFWAE